MGAAWKPRRAPAIRWSKSGAAKPEAGGRFANHAPVWCLRPAGGETRKRRPGHCIAATGPSTSGARGGRMSTCSNNPPATRSDPFASEHNAKFCDRAAAMALAPRFGAVLLRDTDFSDDAATQPTLRDAQLLTHNTRRCSRGGSTAGTAGPGRLGACRSSPAGPFRTPLIRLCALGHRPASEGLRSFASGEAPFSLRPCAVGVCRGQPGKPSPLPNCCTAFTEIRDV